jgi:uncharacterized membrane protein YdfJ with MMPL/SSD domain
MMKKLLAITIVALLAFAAWYSIFDYDMVVHIGDEDFNGPFGALIGMVAAGGGLLIAAIAITCAAVFVGFVFAGLGILMVIGMALLAVVLLAAIAPLTLPLLIPLAIIWWIAKRNKRKQSLALEQTV